MPLPFRRSTLVSFAALVAVLGSCATGCGASIQAIYEGDVRFEHCMALDAQPSIQPADRHTCWVEWVRYYTYGQTRDRVVHAQLRIQQLNGARGARIRVKTAPEDGTAHAPLPQLGKSQASLLHAAPADDPARVEACEAECKSVHLDCMGACGGEDATASCRPGCEAGQRACHEQCRR